MSNDNLVKIGGAAAERAVKFKKSQSESLDSKQGSEDLKIIHMIDMHDVHIHKDGFIKTFKSTANPAFKTADIFHSTGSRKCSELQTHPIWNQSQFLNTKFMPNPWIKQACSGTTVTKNSTTVTKNC